MQQTFKIKNGRIDRTKFFKANEKFHKDMAKIPFEQKIRNLESLCDIANGMKKARLNCS